MVSQFFFCSRRVSSEDRLERNFSRRLATLSMEGELVAIHVSSVLAYALSDSGSGRCRMTKRTMSSLKITKMGTIVKLRLAVQSTSITVLCSAWPDTFDVLTDQVICVDSSVVVGEGARGLARWIEGVVTIKEMFSPTIIGSVSVRPLAKQGALPNFLGLPLCPSCAVCDRDGQAIAIISNTNTRGVGLVATSTTVLRAPTSADKTDSTRADETSYSNISVVKEIVNRVIVPHVRSTSTGSHSRLSIHGLLLVGPPGVGKTYAVKAARALCQPFCKVHIYEVDIPSLLCDPDPVATLDKIFHKVHSLRRSPSSSSGSNTVDQQALSLSGTALSSPFTKSSNATPMSTPQSSSAFSPGGFLSAGKAKPTSTTKNNTFVYRSPAAMARSATPATVSSPVSATSACAAGSAVTAGKSTTGRSADVDSVKFSPEVAFIVVDEVDALGTAGHQNEKQIIIKQYLGRWLDAQQDAQDKKPDQVPCCLVATSNRAADIDPMLRRGGRLECELAVSNTPQDRRILLVSLLQTQLADALSPHLQLNGSVMDTLAEKISLQTGGYVAADLASLVRAMCDHLSKTDVGGGGDFEGAVMQSFHSAAKVVTPSCLRGAAISLPRLSYDDVIGYTSVKSSLQRVLCFARPEQQRLSARFGLQSSPGGVLLYGPPGNSKTRLASAAAAHHGLPMISLSAADIYSPYVGDAEAEVRRAFQLARQAAPCVLFIDELDSIVTNRDTAGSGASSSASVEGRVLATLLTEMDGIQNTQSFRYAEDDGISGAASREEKKGHNSSGGVIVLGATNRLDFIDAALIRKGRFHHVLHVPPPNAEERVQLLQYFAHKCNLDSGIVDGLVGQLREGMSGAEVENLCREATIRSLHHHFASTAVSN